MRKGGFEKDDAFDEQIIRRQTDEDGFNIWKE